MPNRRFSPCTPLSSVSHMDQYAAGTGWPQTFIHVAHAAMAVGVGLAPSRGRNLLRTNMGCFQQHGNTGNPPVMQEVVPPLRSLDYSSRRAV